MIRPATGALLLGAFLLAACGSGGKSDPSDPNAGLDPEILAWHKAIEAEHVACGAKVEGRGCDTFEVTCKAMQEITPDEAAKGVTAQVVAAMSFNGRSGGGQAGSAFALFSKAGGKWSRAEAMPVNMHTCAPL